MSTLTALQAWLASAQQPRGAKVRNGPTRRWILGGAAAGAVAGLSRQGPRVFTRDGNLVVQFEGKEVVTERRWFGAKASFIVDTGPDSFTIKGSDLKFAGTSLDLSPRLTIHRDGNAWLVRSNPGIDGIPLGKWMSGERPVRIPVTLRRLRVGAFDASIPSGTRVALGPDFTTHLMAPKGLSHEISRHGMTPMSVRGDSIRVAASPASSLVHPSLAVSTRASRNTTFEFADIRPGSISLGAMHDGRQISFSPDDAAVVSGSCSGTARTRSLTTSFIRGKGVIRIAGGGRMSPRLAFPVDDCAVGFGPDEDGASRSVLATLAQSPVTLDIGQYTAQTRGGG
ncbi:MAG: hypothetical protein EOP83_03010, partial [Verrucomicrobiaceae bacterium]